MSDFYDDKFALWIDLRSHYDSNIHGSGWALNDTGNGVRLTIHRNTSDEGGITCYVFLVANALMEIQDETLKSIMY